MLKLKNIEEELENTKKHIRELEKIRDQHDRTEIKRHKDVINLNMKARVYGQIARDSPTKHEEHKAPKGLWHMEYTEDNYNKIKQELD